MAITVTEIMGSRGFRTDQGKIIGERVFLVSGVSNPQEVRAIYGTATTPDAMPNTGFPFPDGTLGLFATDSSIAQEPGHQELFRVVWQHENVEPTGVDPNAIGYVEWNTSQTAAIDQIWRSNPSFTSAPNGDIVSPRADIGGNKEDSGGEPASFPRYNAILTITEVVKGPIAVTPFAAVIRRRNSVGFAGQQAGAWLFTGADTSRIALNKFRLSYRFQLDEWFHLQQRPQRTTEGIIAPLKGTTIYKDCAESVYWYQPFPLKADFTQMSPNW